MFSAHQIKNQFPDLVSMISGEESRLFSNITSIEKQEPNSFVFFSDEKKIDAALQNKQIGLVVSQKAWKRLLGSVSPDQTIIVSTNVSLLLARSIQHFLYIPPRVSDIESGIHILACVSKLADVHPSAVVSPFAVVGPHCEVRSGCWIGPHVTIEDNCIIGEQTRIEASVFIGKGTEIGQHCILKPNTTIASEGFGMAHDASGRHFRIHQRGKVILEDYVEVGSGCTIDRATFDETRISEGTKLDNQIHIAHNCHIGKHGIITAGANFAGSVSVGDHFMSGGNISVTDHVTIAEKVHLGGLSAVSNDITESGAYGGYPLQKIKDYLRTTANLANITEMRKNIHRIMTFLKMETDDSD